MISYYSKVPACAETPKEIKTRLNKVERLAGEVNIKFNPAKPFSLHLSTQENDEYIRSLCDGEFDEFLAIPGGFQITRDTRKPARLMKAANKIL